MLLASIRIVLAKKIGGTVNVPRGGLVGSGRSELARAIFGIDPLRAGEVRVEGRTVAIRGPCDALRAGIVLVPEDRKREGLVMLQSVLFNATVPWLADWIRWAMPSRRRRHAIAQRAVRDFAIKLAGQEQIVERLSGGNQQKVLVGRWMEHPPKVLILDEPTRGVDVGARAEIYQKLRDFAAAGTSVIMISSDLPELIGMCDRILVIHNGMISGQLGRADFTEEKIMALSAGIEYKPSPNGKEK
jgi:ABC-type sugar transport system ATPase subunit